MLIGRRVVRHASGGQRGARGAVATRGTQGHGAAGGMQPSMAPTGVNYPPGLHLGQLRARVKVAEPHVPFVPARGVQYAPRWLRGMWLISAAGWKMGRCASQEGEGAVTGRDRCQAREGVVGGVAGGAVARAGPLRTRGAAWPGTRRQGRYQGHRWKWQARGLRQRAAGRIQPARAPRRDTARPLRGARAGGGSHIVPDRVCKQRRVLLADDGQ
jgi:hypothetical protein